MPTTPPQALEHLPELLALLPQAVLRVGPEGRVAWVEPAFAAKTGLTLAPGADLLDALERGRGRDALERALRARAPFDGRVLTTSLKQVRARLEPLASGGGTWVVLEPAGVDEEVAFARALQELARAVGESLDVEAVCAAAVLALVRCAQVQRAEVHLLSDAAADAGAPEALRRVAVSDAAGTPERADGALPPEEGEALQAALATGQPQIGVQRGWGDALGSLFAALPLQSQRRTLGLLLLYKEPGASFSARELDLWSAASGQLAVAVQNARLLRETQRALQMREEFMSVASHELRTPLTPLTLCLVGMERRLAAGQPVDPGSVAMGRRQVERMTALVGEMLDASRLELGHLSLARAPLELGQLAAEVVDTFRRAFERPFLLAVPAERVWVSGDRDRLEQVLVNLLENAHKYSPAGAAVQVALERVGGEARVRVEDRGIGIPRADQAGVFRRFGRARNASHRHFQGLGLGLFISHSIAQLHGGTLQVASAEGQGSTFTLALPALGASAVAALPPRVLLLEDDAALAHAAERALREGGYEVLSAREGADVLRRAVHLPLDAVLVPAGAGPEAAGRGLELLVSLPRARPLPLLFCGPELPAWAPAGARLLPRPCTAEALRAALAEPPRARGVLPALAALT